MFEAPDIGKRFYMLQVLDNLSLVSGLIQFRLFLKIILIV